VKGNTKETGGEAILNYSLLFRQSAKFTSQLRLFETFTPIGEDIYWENRLFLKTGPRFTTEIEYIVYFDYTRIAAHSWPSDIESMFYVALGFSFNIFQK
jgi:hypothetical protein